MLCHVALTWLGCRKQERAFQQPTPTAFINLSFLFPFQLWVFLHNCELYLSVALWRTFVIGPVS
jgi:hypothetical protein